MAKVTIADQQYESGDITLKALKSAWPHIKQNQEAARALRDSGEQPDPIQSMDTAVAIISACFVKNNPSLTPEWIEDNITAVEVNALNLTIVEIMREAGFVTASSGEEEPSEKNEAAASTATSTD